MKSYAIAELAALSTVSAHNNAICSCTDADLPGEVSFYYGSYHSSAGSGALGEVNIMQAGNTVPPCLSRRHSPRTTCTPATKP